MDGLGVLVRHTENGMTEITAAVTPETPPLSPQAGTHGHFSAAVSLHPVWVAHP
jgi:hypothetical protein